MISGIMVSGWESDFVAFKAPSGQWNVNLDAFLTSMSASFGFNLTPHRFSLQFIPENFNGASGQLPDIGTYTTYEVRQGSCSQGFLIAGNVVHADYQNSSNGTVVRVDIEDRRKDFLDQLKISSEDLGASLPSGLVSVARMYRLTTGFDDVSGISDSRVKEYRNIVELGCTYQQIYEAIVWARNNGDITFNPSGLPHPNILAANTLGNLEPMRWKFNAQPLSEVISTVLNDTAYDWYWGMQDDIVKVVNRKVTFDVTEDSIAVQSLQPESTDFRFGADVVQAPSKITVLGAPQHGILNSTLLSPIDGIDNPSVSMIFNPAWSNIKVGFIDAYGVYRSYYPRDTELQMALKSIEHWTYYKIFQSGAAPSGWGYAGDAGTEAAKHHTFQSRLDPSMPLADFYNNPQSGMRVIANRVDAEHNWVLEWYSAVQNHANSHYGRTYALEGFLFNEDNGEYRLVDAAWCNLENQRQDSSAPFQENYEIDIRYAPIAPFVTQDFRVRAHAVLPSSTVYGVDGYQVPASFADWNEDVHPSGTLTFNHYIPVDLQRVGQKVIDPRAEDDAFEDYPEGTVIAQLPLIAGLRVATETVLGNLVTLYEQGVAIGNSGIQDVLNPYSVMVPYSGLSGVAIPVQINKRYGQGYPSTWTSGTGSGTRNDIVVDDQYAPWNFFPVNQKTSITVMGEKVSGLMDARLVNVLESRFAEINKVDWPIISFDGFANQQQISGLYGRRDHGITDISVSVNGGIPQTRYGIKSFFAEFGKEAPLGERNIGILEGIIHPIDYTTFEVTAPTRPNPDISHRGDRPILPPAAPVGIRKEVYAVTITEVFNRGSASEPERYFSVTKDGVSKPGGIIDPLDSLDLICRDGFFNVGDKGLYVVEYKSNGQRRRYYTGGTDLAIGSHVVAVSNVGASTVDVVYRGFALTSVPLMSGVSITDVSAGDQGKLLSDGTPKPATESVTGIRPDRPVPTGIWFEPVVGAAGSAATPVVISGITNFGLSSATAQVQGIWESGSQGNFVGSGAYTNGVEIIPFPHLAQSGDIGILASFGNVNYIFINRQTFATFGA